MHSRQQRYIFYTTSIASIILVALLWLWISDILNLSEKIRYSSPTAPVALFLVSWIYPSKIFDSRGVITGMHREGVKASAFFVFASICIPMDELWGREYPVLIFPAVILIAMLLYKIMLYALSSRDKVDGKPINTERFNQANETN